MSHPRLVPWLFGILLLLPSSLAAKVEDPDGDAPGIPATIQAHPALPTEFAYTFSMPYGAGDEFPRDPQEFDRMLGLLKGAGFNTVHCPYEPWRVELFKKHGMKMMIDVLAWQPPIEADIRRHSQRPKVKEMCEKLRGNDAIWGYNLWNERLDWCGNFKYLDAWIRMLRTWDGTHPVWVGTYLYLYCEHFPTEPGCHAWYDYAFSRGLPWHFAMLKFYRGIAQKHHGSMGKWLEILDYNRDLYQVNTSIAYGVKTILWFIGGPYGPREHDLSKRWDPKSHMIRVAKRIEPLFGLLGEMGIPYAVYSTPTRRDANNHDKPLGIPNSTEAFPADFWLQVKQGEVLCGMFKLKDGTDVAYVANHNAWAWQGLVMDVQQKDGPVVVSQFDLDKKQWVKLAAQKRLSLSLGPAEAILLRFDHDKSAKLADDQEPAGLTPAEHFAKAGRQLAEEKLLAQDKDKDKDTDTREPQFVYATSASRTVDNQDQAPGLPAGAAAFPGNFWVDVKQGEVVCGMYKLSGDAEAMCVANANRRAWQGAMVAPRQLKAAPIVVSEFDPAGGKWDKLGAWEDVNFALAPGESLLLRFDGVSKAQAAIDALPKKAAAKAPPKRPAKPTGPAAPPKPAKAGTPARAKPAKAGTPARGTPATAPPLLKEKTLIAWISLANLDQKTGGVLSLREGDAWDGLVLAEPTLRRWVASSEKHLRTNTDEMQRNSPAETAKPDDTVAVAVVYAEHETTIYRDGKPYLQWKPARGLKAFNLPVRMMLGHCEEAWGLPHCFHGSIQDARVYNLALSAEQIAALRPKQESDPKPWASWTFDGQQPLADHAGHFAELKLNGHAKIANGKLELDGFDSWAWANALAPDYHGPNYRLPMETVERDIPLARELHHRLLADPWRPGYHFVNPEGHAFPFDPNGGIFWKGRYHLFYIYQEGATHCWGHISSHDLIHWRYHPPGLFPTPDSPEKGIFSGACFVNNRGEATIMYHGVGVGNCIATSSDKNLDTWKKLPTNPCGAGLQTTPKPPYSCWDPHAWRDGNMHYAIFGGIAGYPPAVFKSTGLKDWQYVGPALSKDIGGGDVSCPDMFKLGDKWVLMCISHHSGCRYYVGEWKNEQFHPEHHERMSWKDAGFFASESLQDDRGRRIMWAWINEARERVAERESGWSGTMSLPRELTMGPDSRLRIRPVEELKRLRYNPQELPAMTLAADGERPLPGIESNSCELLLEMKPDSAARQCGVAVCRSPDGAEQTLVYYDAAEKKLVIDTRRSTQAKSPTSIEAGPLELAEGETLKLRIFVDKSVVEVFANDRQAVVRPIAPSRGDSLGAALFSKGGGTEFSKIEAWEMMPSNPF